MKRTKLVERLMESAFDTSDRCPGQCWTLTNDKVGALGCAYDSKKELENAVKKFVKWLTDNTK